jgi:predicted phosphodiesterase
MPVPSRRTRPRDVLGEELLKAAGTPEELRGPAPESGGSAIAVVADVHGETAALAAVVEEARAEGIERWRCLGDSVEWLLPRDPQRRGDPDALRWALDHAEIVLAGNHEAALMADPHGRQRLAAEPDGQALLARLTNRPAHQSVDVGGTSVELVHGSPADPVWGVIEIKADVEEAFRRSRARIILCGHTHVPLIARCDASGVRLEAHAEMVALDLADTRWLLNPGSVGRAPSGLAHWGVLHLDTDGQPVLFQWRRTRWAGTERLFR